MNTKFYIALLLPLMSLCTLNAQQMFRSVVDCYIQREDAVDRLHRDQSNTLPFSPSSMSVVEGMPMLTFDFTLPYAWSDQNVYLHLESAKSAYTLLVNGHRVAVVGDSFSPVDFDISPYIKQGANIISTLMRATMHPELEYSLAQIERPVFEGSYLFTQNKRKVRDYFVNFAPNYSEPNCAMLEVGIVVENSYNYAETVEVGYDIYDPNGKLLDYNIREIEVAGRACDTLIFRCDLYGVDNFRWSDKTPHLYDVMLYTKREEIIRDYIPLRIGYREISYMGGAIYNFDDPILLKSRVYNATNTEQQSREELAALKRAGINAIMPQYLQPNWLYDICDEIGIYIIEQPGFNTSLEEPSRKEGGTPANNPALTSEYLRRVRASYYSTRNHASVVGYSLATSVGNGYPLYKGYELLKSLETNRPIIYMDAQGEWNSDNIELGR